MIVGFSKYGTGAASSAFDYLLTVKDKARPPEIVRGCARLTGELIDSLSFKHKYTSGVLSFAPGETITPEIEQAIIDEFEAHAFAGLDSDQYSICWIRHTHADHHELHFVTARCELSTGKSLNIAPPEKKDLLGRRPYFDDFRSMINARYGLADPDDPDRERGLKIPDHEAKIVAMLKRGAEPNEQEKAVLDKAELRDALHDLLILRVREGLINSRDDVLKTAVELGFEINRAGKDYITVRHNDLKIKMKGGIYEQQFDRAAALEAEARAAADRASSAGTQRDFTKADPAAAERYAQIVAAAAAKRAAYNAERYQQKHEQSALASIEKRDDVASSDVVFDLRGFLRQRLGSDAIPGERDNRAAANDTAVNGAGRAGSVSAVSGQAVRADRRDSTAISGWLSGNQGVLNERATDSVRARIIGTVRTIAQTVIQKVSGFGAKIDRIIERANELLRAVEERERSAADVRESLERASSKLSAAIESLDKPKQQQQSGMSAEPVAQRDTTSTTTLKM